MLALISLLTIVILSIVVVRIGGIALELTGLSHDVASFQAQSAFSGVGFTTSESESIVSHPVRRRITRILILFGSAGITTSIATLILTFVGQPSADIALRGIYLLSGLLVIFILSRAKFIQTILKKIIVKALSKSKALQLYDYQEILGITKGYSISRILMKSDNWAVGRKLKELRLHQEGTLILSIQRKVEDMERFAVPSGETEILAGDTLTVYGRDENCKCLAERHKGEQGEKAHRMRCVLEEKLARVREEVGDFTEV